MVTLVWADILGGTTDDGLLTAGMSQLFEQLNTIAHMSDQALLLSKPADKVMAAHHMTPRRVLLSMSRRATPYNMSSTTS